MRSIISLFVLGAGLGVVANPIVPYTVHEKRTSLPMGWSHSRRHDSSAALPLRFGLTQNNIADIGEYLHDVSHPDSPNYGKHWTASQIAEAFAPSDETVSNVHSWLIDNGFDSSRIRVTPAKSWIEVDATVEEAESLLRTEYNIYGHESGSEHVACESYHLPAHLIPHIDIVTPTVHFDAKLARRANAPPAVVNGKKPGMGNAPKTTGVVTNLLAGTDGCDQQITPACLQALYGLNYTPVSTSSNSIGIVEYTPQAFVQSDINMFASSYAPDLNGKAPVVVSIDGGVVQTTTTGFNDNGESNLDLQYAMSIVTAAQPVTLYQAGDIVEGASFNNFLDAIDGSYCTFEGGDAAGQDSAYPDTSAGGYNGKDCGTVTPANVISTSYTYNEGDLSVSYATRQCAEYAKLGLMGVTILYSSGDSGVAGSGGACLANNAFSPTFPGSCPYVTAVGATQINSGSTVSDPEGACEQVIYSGGGFSNYFSLPSYQSTAVSSFLTNYPPPYTSSQYNSTGQSRGIPDISANGANYVVAVDGSFSLVYGTSASSPVAAAIFTLINDARLAAGKAPIGFINPTIYSSAFNGAFNDITTGGNQGCGTNGFSSAPGWDPVTGLGTPNFPKLLSAWLALP
ncbi:hypothetical protein SERLA73DRAFT_159455 [Serpula lacrymans var. lacrymans S7.3]|uniref:tripeptidyl-peptidase II n=2 Tax=Serpula lacrymans var. lacrymans TaxID=341189 RepID=F8PSM0_SERL3|nr:uncharacterized protein SERLADRAFT_414416 [Serpula lacrymans var. lacrymans S7.9]EGO00779.1 hypothetical protein SERLA73DRAFT_159455 [Serpula lacrymans var. lacrymans S7.3]EGO26342.1 hypothetical protein SERLADRAFT_414416 [Serpula lacrymans var. lacrymans S7.9]